MPKKISPPNIVEAKAAGHKSLDAALRYSQRKWIYLALTALSDDGGADTCALCHRYAESYAFSIDTRQNDSPDGTNCEDCPIVKYSVASCGRSTSLWSKHRNTSDKAQMTKAALALVNFFRSRLKQKPLTSKELQERYEVAE